MMVIAHVGSRPKLRAAVDRHVMIQHAFLEYAQVFALIV